MKRECAPSIHERLVPLSSKRSRIILYMYIFIYKRERERLGPLSSTSSNRAIVHRVARARTHILGLALALALAHHTWSFSFSLVDTRSRSRDTRSRSRSRSRSSCASFLFHERLEPLASERSRYYLSFFVTPSLVTSLPRDLPLSFKDLTAPPPRKRGTQPEQCLGHEGSRWAGYGGLWGAAPQMTGDDAE
jgi:hypothetical protein